MTLYYIEPQAERMPGVEGRSCSQRKIFVLIVFSSEYYRLQAGGIFVGKKFRLEHRSWHFVSSFERTIPEVTDDKAIKSMIIEALVPFHSRQKKNKINKIIFSPPGCCQT